MNIVVKEVCKAAGLDRVIENPSTRVQARGVERKHLWELVTNHTGRRTFATNVYNLDIISLGELMSLTGHESESSLMVYLNVSRLDVSRRAGLRLTAKAKELGL
jgi:integrase